MKKKVVIVTGASSGIGKAAAERFCREGSEVVLADTVDPRATAEEVGAALALQVDVADERQTEQLVAETRSTFGGLDVLVNAAGVNRRARVSEAPLEDWESIIGTNLKGTFLCCRAAVPAMRDSGGGAIVNVGSERAFVVGPSIPIYSASKGGVTQLTRAMALDHWRDGIRVNCVCPGPIRTPMLERGIDEAPDPPARYREVEASTIMGRVGEAHEVANVIYFLASEEASFMTGSLVLVDGGVTAKGP